MILCVVGDMQATPKDTVMCDTKPLDFQQQFQARTEKFGKVCSEQDLVLLFNTNLLFVWFQVASS